MAANNKPKAPRRIGMIAHQTGGTSGLILAALAAGILRDQTD